MKESLNSNAALNSKLHELEAIRKQIASKKIQGWGGVIMGGTIFIAGSMLNAFLVSIAGVCLVLIGAFVLSILGKKLGLYRSRYKREIVSAALSHIDPSLQMNPEGGISKAEFENSQLFTTQPDRYATEDLVKGKADQTRFYFAEVHAQYQTQTPTKNGTKTEWHDIFKGIIFCADFNKNFNSTTVVRPRDLGNRIGAWFNKNIYAFDNNNVVALENDYFSKNFVTYSNDQIEARYILTPALMERIEELNERSAYCISLSFINSAMYIAFPLSHNYFEPPIFKTLLRENFLAPDLNVLSFMYGITQELDLNTRIWTKR